ncbi:myosin light chain kinase family member 4 isoform X2 [Gouania willdenowi]|uniref:myosin light chain kinase family member 4 isoform X2 n=1 Tax=Gouania willdenowi TaxID=441366 RepID=UPI001054D8C8|nr:myosin light chain kinase family member 4 isoform X2 [Gouania willdenowi]
MGGKEKTILVIANLPDYKGSEKKTLSNESGQPLPSSAPPPIPMSPIVEKMEGLKAIRNRSNSLRLGRLAFYRHLEKVETMRSFWELKYVELQGGKQQAKDEKDKSKQSQKSQKKRKPVDTADISSLNEPALHKQVEKLNKQNTELYHQNTDVETQKEVDKASVGQKAELILDGGHTPTAQSSSPQDPQDKKDGEEEEEEVFDSSESEEEELKVEDVGPEQGEEVESPEKPAQESSEDGGESASCSKRRVTEEDLVKDEPKKSRVEDGEEQNAEAASEASEPQEVKSDETKTDDEETTKKDESSVKEFVIDSSPPPMAPFEHRIVTPKPHQIANYYTINRDQVLGGGRFGQVHKCTENSTALMLAAKIIKARSQKEKEVVRNEIQVMNQLNHANLIQLYAAFESRHDIILVMEYVEGGELFDRIIDENYNLTELDTVLFIRQICEGLQYMHKMYILHLDLKPENILCVSRATNKIKIIDFGLARRYKPREKLRVNFGTPEFLAPEVINYEFVSFPTDMWSLGVITYMLLSGLSPFLGDDDNETLNNILACQWNFEEEEFSDISDEAKDFITRLLVKSKSWRMSAAESLRHPWLSDRSLHHTLNQKKNKCHSTHAPPPPES